MIWTPLSIARRGNIVETRNDCISFTCVIVLGVTCATLAFTSATRFCAGRRNPASRPNMAAPLVLPGLTSVRTCVRCMLRLILPMVAKLVKLWFRLWVDSIICGLVATVVLATSLSD